MLIISLESGSQHSIDVPRITTELLRQFRGAAITASDSHEADRERTRATMKALMAKGCPVRKPDAIFRSIDEREREIGRSMDIRLPVSNCIFDGCVAASRIVLRGECSADDPDAMGLVRTLETLTGLTARVGMTSSF